MATQQHTHRDRPNTLDYRRLDQRAVRAMTVEERFWAKVNVWHPSSCWEWMASLVPVSGYGAFTPHTGKRVNAHRWAYESLVGPVPDGLHLDHLCRNRACVNPDHLEPVTPRVNFLRGAAPGALAIRASKDRCDLGHLYSEYAVVRAGRRQCRRCRAVYARAWVAGFRGKLTADALMRYSRDGDAARFLQDTRKWKRRSEAVDANG